jgi:HEAT repeat protein
MNRYRGTKPQPLDRKPPGKKYSSDGAFKIVKFAGNVILAFWTGMCLLYSCPAFAEAVSRSGVARISYSGSSANEKEDREIQQLAAALHGSNSYERQQAAIALGATGAAGAVEPLITALKDEDSFVRDFAVRSLGNLGDPRAVGPMIQMLDDKNLLVRRSAAISLGELADPRAVDPLIAVLNNDHFTVRRAAAEALGRIQDPKAVDPLIQSLYVADNYIQASAAEALAKIGKPAVPKLVAALVDWTAGPGIAEILKELNWRPSSDEEKIHFDVANRDTASLLDNWPAARRVLIEDAESGNSRQVHNAVFALIGLGREEIVDELIGILNDKGSMEMAAAFLDCGNEALLKAARDWAMKHGHEIKNGEEDPIVEWGRMELTLK